jgi:hypothetical protein
LRQADAAELAGGVGAVFVAPFQARLGVNLDDDARALRFHQLGSLAGTQEVAREVHIDLPLPLFEAHLGQLGGVNDPCVGNQDVQPAELLGDLLGGADEPASFAATCRREGQSAWQCGCWA